MINYNTHKLNSDRIEINPFKKRIGEWDKKGFDFIKNKIPNDLDFCLGFDKNLNGFFSIGEIEGMIEVVDNTEDYHLYYRFDDESSYEDYYLVNQKIYFNSCWLFSLKIAENISSKNQSINYLL